MIAFRRDVEEIDEGYNTNAMKMKINSKLNYYSNYYASICIVSFAIELIFTNCVIVLTIIIFQCDNSACSLT